jgi:hypothetical protein
MKVILLGTKEECVRYFEQEIKNSVHYQVIKKPFLKHQNRHNPNSPFWRMYIDVKAKEDNNS